MEKYGIECNRIYYPQDSDEITKLIGEIELEYLKGDSYYPDAVTMLAEKLLINIARANSTPYSGGGIDEIRRNEFTNARAAIHMDYAKNWTVEEMAKAC